MNTKIIENLQVIDISSEGLAVAKHNELVIFIANAVPGDIIDVEITRKKNKYAEGKAIKFHSYSEKRANPACSHFGVCGGCKWQNIDYKYQLEFKQKQVVDALTRIGKIDIKEIRSIKPSANHYNYRNKLEFTFSAKKWLTNEQIKSEEKFENRNGLGFHIPRMFDKVLDIDKCYLQDDFSNDVRDTVKEYALQNNVSFYDIREQKGLLRNLLIRNTTIGEWMVAVVFFENEKEVIEGLMNHLKSTFPQITSLLYFINHKKNDTVGDLPFTVFSGKDHIVEKFGEIEYKIGPKSFFQTNPVQAHEMYKAVLDLADLKGNELVYDLYTGTGSIANFVAHKALAVVGIEYVKEATDDAKYNSEINKITNTSFFAGDMKDILTTDFVAANGKPDVIITDPPRAGMHEDVVNRIKEIVPDKIVYVSCNPATQARDLALLKELYEVVLIQPFDMFPHTTHVENIALLHKR
ncbi:MAG: 23S rRNA (uracil(1939)-C(5))-methyltransferase RlmD [Bacteroidetes bacterium]|nr:23S rRNA (uracil(1939)-C(5))-methyltransferase RlmD [Bacteroidota bacterium]